MITQIIESKTHRKYTYDICFDGREYFLLASNSIGFPEVMSYHSTSDEASDASDLLPGEQIKLISFLTDFPIISYAKFIILFIKQIIL